MEGLDPRWHSRGIWSRNDVDDPHPPSDGAVAREWAQVAVTPVTSTRRATVVQHHDRKQPSQPTRPTRGTPVTNDIATNQRSQRRAENVDTVGSTGSIPVSPTSEMPVIADAETPRSRSSGSPCNIRAIAVHDIYVANGNVWPLSAAGLRRELLSSQLLSVVLTCTEPLFSRTCRSVVVLVIVTLSIFSSSLSR